MELTTARTTANESLLLQLTAFGLDPREWRLLPLNSCLFGIIHKEDRNFMFLGWADRAAQSWEQLQLLSL